MNKRKTLRELLRDVYDNYELAAHLDLREGVHACVVKEAEDNRVECVIVDTSFQTLFGVHADDVPELVSLLHLFVNTKRREKLKNVDG